MARPLDALRARVFDDLPTAGNILPSVRAEGVDMVVGGLFGVAGVAVRRFTFTLLESDDFQKIQVRRNIASGGNAESTNDQGIIKILSK